MFRLATYLFILLVSFLMGGATCLAGSPSKASPDQETYQLESMTVTARKTEEDAQKVPVSTTVVSGELLEDAHIDDSRELTRFAPNVYFKKTTSENVISMRG